jgi:hypothetical protein
LEVLLRLARNIHRVYAGADPALKRRYISIFWERIEIADWKIVKAVPTKAFQACFSVKYLSEDVVITDSFWRATDPPIITGPQCPSRCMSDSNYWRNLKERLAELDPASVPSFA